MKFIFIPPAETQGSTSDAAFYPMGLLSLMSVLRYNNGVESQIINVPLYFRNKKEVKSAAIKVLSHAPDVVAFSTWCHSYPGQILLAQAIKSARPSVTVIFGGPQATVTDQDTLEHFPEIDFIIRGEAERSLPSFLETILNGGVVNKCKGLTYRVDGAVRRTYDADPITDLDALPMPAFDLLKDHLQIALDVGRGCPYRCTFCTTSQFFKRRYRIKSPTRIIKEIEHLLSEYGTTRFAFTHDLFTLKKSFVKEICGLILKKGLPVTWSCMTRVDCIDEPLMELMSRAGCQVIGFGVESGSKTMQSSIGKNLDLEKMEKTIKAASRNNIRASCSFIIGFPEETPADAGKTIKGIYKCFMNNAYVSLNLLSVLPGTPLFMKHREELMYDGLSSVSTGIFSGKQEQSLIRLHPEIFSAYYYVKSRAAPRNIHIGLFRLANLINSFRYSVRLACMEFGLEPGRINILKLLTSWLSQNYTENDSPFDKIESTAITYLLSAIKKKTSSGLRFPFISDVIAMEQRKYRMLNEIYLSRPSFRDTAYNNAEYPSTEALLLKKPNWCIIKSSYDLIQILKNIDDGRIKKLNPSRGKYFFVVQALARFDVDDETGLLAVSEEKSSILDKIRPLMSRDELLEICCQRFPRKEALQFVENLLRFGLVILKNRSSSA